MKDEPTSNRRLETSENLSKQTSSVIIRLEIDDIDINSNITKEKIYDLTPIDQIQEVFNFNSDLEAVKSVDLTKESLNKFIGRRESRYLIIQTYRFEKMFKQNKLDSSDVETNSMTMQTALETAYSDWNREKKHSELVTENSDQGKDRIKPVVIQEENENKTTELSFYYGNPTVDIVKGFIHIYRDKLVLVYL